MVLEEGPVPEVGPLIVNEPPDWRRLQRRNEDQAKQNERHLETRDEDVHILA